MTNVTSKCDLCPATAPSETALSAGFTKIGLQGEGPGKLRDLIAPGETFLDLCRDCTAAFIAWAVLRRDGPPVVVAEPEPEPEPHVEPTPEPEPAPAHAEPEAAHEAEAAPAPDAEPHHDSPPEHAAP